MKVKKVFRKIHLYLGLVSGMAVFLIALTGCLYAFQAEFRSLQSFRHVSPLEGEFNPPSVLGQVARNALPGKKLHAILYHGKDRSAEAIFYNYAPDYYYYIAYLNPYSAEVITVRNMEHDFFQWILDGHYYLWLPPAIGQPVAAYSTLIFVVMLITGLILWWPKNKKAAPSRFRIRWKAGWKRRNFDLHGVAGFYVMAVALLLALTGLVWGFQWFASAVYQVTGGEKSLTYIDPVSSAPSTGTRDVPAIDRVYGHMTRAYPDAAAIEIHLPDKDSTAIAANANPSDGTYWKLDYRYFDQHSLKEIKSGSLYGRLSEADTADKLIRMNYDIHTGAIAGLPGKIIMFLASLLVASLPVTGILLWYGRNFRKKAPVSTARRRQIRRAEADKYQKPLPR